MVHQRLIKMIKGLELLSWKEGLRELTSFFSLEKRWLRKELNDKFKYLMLGVEKTGQDCLDTTRSVVSSQNKRVKYRTYHSDRRNFLNKRIIEH